MAGGQQGYAVSIIAHGRRRCGGFHDGKQVESRAAFAPLHVTLHDSHTQGGQIGVLGVSPRQYVRQGPGGGEGAVWQGLVFQMRQGFLPVTSSEQEGKAAGPEARRAIQARHPFVMLVVVGAPGDGASTGLQRQLGERRQICDLLLLGAHMRGGESGAEGLRRRINLGIEPRHEQELLAAESLLMAALHLPQQFRRRVAPSLALVVGGQAHQRACVKPRVQRAAPTFRRVQSARVHALGVGLPHIHGPGFRDGRVQHLEGAFQILVIRQEIRAQQQAALSVHGLAGG